MENWFAGREGLDELLRALAVAAVGIVVLRAFYRAFSSRWPENYFGGSSGVDPVISQSPLRYLSFRALPVLLVAYAAAVVAERVGSDRVVVVIATWAGYSLTSSIPSIWHALMDGQPKIGLAAYRLGGLMVTGIVSAIAIALGDRFDPYIPSGSEMAFAFWIALATVATAHWGRSLMARRPATGELLARARREVDEELLKPLQDAHHPSVAMLYALAYAEHLNRPGWVRALERALLRRGGSYGLMQMRSERPLTDAESVSRFLELLPSYPKIGDEDEWGDARRFFLHHNADADFADLALEFYWALREELDTRRVPGQRIARDVTPAVLMGSAVALGGAAALARRIARRRHRAAP